MTAEEREEITNFAATQWSLILLEDLEERPADLDWCIRDIAE